MFFVGVDVGSRSVRAILVSTSGEIIFVHVEPISVHKTRPDYFEQSSIEVWDAVCKSVKDVLKTVDKEAVKGIGFDATCSLVVLDKKYNPISVNLDQREKLDIIMWMDHRAKEEADFINSKSHKFLKYVGGKVSLEMQLPKLLWLKKHLDRSWTSAAHFMGLPDYLTFRATGALSRSICSLVCKWAYISDGTTCGWGGDLLSDIGLEDLKDNNYSKIGNKVLKPGDLVGGLSARAADEMGLVEGTPVAASIIDAHAGGLALVFAGLRSDLDGNSENICSRLGLICGTSTCHMCLSPQPIFVPGVWGPYWNAMVPNMWLNEGGQSATGCLVDHIVSNHPAAKNCPKDCDIYSWLENILKDMASRKGLTDASFLTEELHVYPDFHGNRSPLADPSLKGMISGLTLDTGVENLALFYLATLQAISYGTKDIVDQLTESGHQIRTVMMCGGLSSSRAFTQLTADVLDLPVLIPHQKESVLLGAAILGASASGYFGTDKNLSDVAKAMAGGADCQNPKPELHRFHQRKFEVFKKMQQDQVVYKDIMKP